MEERKEGGNWTEAQKLTPIYEIYAPQFQQPPGTSKAQFPAKGVLLQTELAKLLDPRRRFELKNRDMDFLQVAGAGKLSLQSRNNGQSIFTIDTAAS